VIEIFNEFHLDNNYTLKEIIRISTKFNHDEDFFKQIGKLFQKYMQELSNSYKGLFEIASITKENIDIWEYFPEIYEEIKEESKMTSV